MKTKLTDELFKKRIDVKNSGLIKGGAHTTLHEWTGENNCDTRTTTWDDCGNLESVTYSDTLCHEETEC